jgi:hypothetical protein
MLPTNAKQPLFLFAQMAREGQYVKVGADFNAPTDVILARGVYCLTAIGVDLTFAVDDSGTLDGRNGHHLPAGDTRLVAIFRKSNLTIALLAGETTAGQINISQVRPVPERF